MNKSVCPNCGAENTREAKYCSRCGHEIPVSATPLVESTSPELSAYLSRKKRQNRIGLIIGLIGFVILIFGGRLVLQKGTLIVVQKFVTQLNSNCPVMLDQYTRLESVSLPSPNVVKYTYTIVGIERSQINVDTLKKYVEPSLIENAKSNQELKIFRTQKMTMLHSYQDLNGVPVYELTITPDMYKQSDHEK